ncbi:MAG: hypothetical protein OXG78_07795 [Chloroflexi bacterium]|nr:hypothetical protein [Chloroflexota bacterium]
MKHLLLAIAMLLSAVLASGQDELRPGVSSQSWDVFIQRGAENPIETVVIFIDLLTGESIGVVTAGERYTLVGGAVLYFDHAEQQVKLVKPDGIIRDHSFVAMDSGDFRIDWAVSGDGRRIAWANSHKSDDNLLTTTLKVADAAGTEIRELLVYGPRQGIRLVPVAFAGNSETFYLEVHADGTQEAGTYTRRSGLFALDYGGKNVVTSALPGEETCYCAVGFGNDFMLRLVAGGDSAGPELEIHELRTGALRKAPPVSLGDYNEAGNLLVSLDGTLAVYALSQVSGYATDQEEIRSVIVLVDLENARQMAVNYPMSAPVRPISFTEDNSALLLTQAGIGGTWKMQLDDGGTVKVADSVYLGTIGGSAEN